MSRNGRLVAIGGLGTRVWHVAAAPPQRLNGFGSGGLIFSPAGRELAEAGGERVVVWILDRPKASGGADGRRDHDRAGVDTSRDGRLVAGSFNDGSVRVWDLTAPPAARQPLRPSGAAYSVRFSPDGRFW